jgi:hypothetical protein
MIPAFNQSGVLPPFLPGDSPANPAAVSPYETTMVEVVQRYGTSQVRREQLQGFLQMRQALRDLGVTDAFQWVDGSFSEDIEATEGRDPGDIDVVTFGSLPEHLSGVEDAISLHPQVFNPEVSKQQFKCDAYFVDMSLPAVAVHFHTCYWLSLFSHRRVSNLWKGMLLVPLGSDDDDAHLALGAMA